jgi:hypothetical protein
MRSSVSEACFLAFLGGLYCCAAFAPQAIIHPRERFFLSLPCDWRFLPKLGPRPSGAARLFSTCGTKKSKGLFERWRTLSDAIFYFVHLWHNNVAVQHAGAEKRRFQDWRHARVIPPPRDPV